MTMASLPTRRQVLTGGGAAALLLLGTPVGGLTGGGYPFALGVASGEPTPDGIILWTRLTRQPLEPDGGMPARRIPVRWEIAEDALFTRRMRHGVVHADPDWGHSVHVALSGLGPGRDYFYRFIALGEASPVGRTRTAPAPGDMPARLRLCFASCQKYEVGNYAAYRHIVADDPDLILFLGDYIYEGAPNPLSLRPHVNAEPLDVGGYRVRHATYRLDPLLQAAHAAAPWAMIWDDHEVANDYGAGHDRDRGDPVAFLRRRAAAYKAYWEHMPLSPARRPRGAAMALYRGIDWGGLARLHLLDDRQYRDPAPCIGDGAYRPLVADCAERRAASASLLGQAQERWLGDAMHGRAQPWSLIAQQTLMTPFVQRDPADPAGAGLYRVDGWDGYPAARARLLRQWRDSGAGGRIVLGGDIHAFAAADMPDPDRPDGPAVAAEFVGGSLTSLNHDAAMGPAMTRSPGFRFAETEVRGYGRLDLTPTGGIAVFRGLTDARDAASAARDIARFSLDPRTPGIASTG